MVIGMFPKLRYLELFQPYWGEDADFRWKDISEAAAFYASVEGDPGIKALLKDLEKAENCGLIVEDLDDRSPVWQYWEWGRRLTPADVKELRARFR